MAAHPEHWLPMPPQAFLSYARIDDDAHPGGVITRLKIALEKEVRAQGGGKSFTIFQDKDGMSAGEHWPSSLEEALQSVRVIIPVLSPSYFDSSPCAWELGKFQQLESAAGRNDLIIPIYFITTFYLEDEEQKKSNPIADLLAERQRFDWRELRFEPFDSTTVTKELAKLAQAVTRVLNRKDVASLVQERNRLRDELSRRETELSELKNKLNNYAEMLDGVRKDASSLTQERDWLLDKLSLRGSEVFKLKEKISSSAIAIAHPNQGIDSQHNSSGERLEMEDIVNKAGNEKKISYRYLGYENKTVR